MKRFLKGFSDTKSRLAAVCACAVYAVCSYTAMMAFFGNERAACIGAACGFPVFIVKLSGYLYKCRQERIEAEFCIMLRQLSMSLSSGSTLENAVKEIILTDRKSYKTIGCALERVYGMLRNNLPAETAFRVFARSCDSKEITVFSQVLSAGIPAGINLSELVRSVSSALRAKADAEHEIRRMLNAPKYNNRIIMAMPVCCIMLFKSMAPSYVAPLYSGAGRLVMAAVMLLILAAWFIGERISNIKY